MKKYFIVSIISNIIISCISFYGLLQYLVMSASKSFSSNIDLLVLLSVVLLDLAINYIIYKLLKSDIKKIYILIPSSIYLLVIGLLLSFIG